MGLNSITLQSNDSDVISGDIVGRINWAASNDGDGPVATSIAASISAVAEETFNDFNNATSLIFSTADDATAAARLKITSGGHLLPFADSSYDLGSDNFYFRSIYADKYYGDIDGPIVVECRNDTGSTISKGSPVYVSGYYSANGKPQIAASNAASSSTMPAIGILADDLTDGSEGHVHCFGLVTQINTASFSVGDTVYVASGGGLTNSRPTGATDLVQNIGRVLRSDSSQGRILVLGPGRTNDTPNSLDVTGTITAPNIGTGEDDSVVVLDSDGKLRTDEIDSRVWGGTLVDGAGTANHVAKWSDSDTLTDSVIYDDGTNVGIGTTSPSYKLDIRYPTGGGMALIKDSDSNDGLLFGDMAYSTSDAYQGIKHVGMTGTSDYMLLSEGTNTLMSAKGTAGKVYIRGGGNYGSNQILVYGSSGYTENAAIELDAVAGKEIVVNQQQRNVDFRVESDTDEYLLFTDASNDRVGIGTATPSEKLDIYGGNILSSALAGVGGGIGKADDGVHILYPGGGTYGGSSASTVTGYIKIKLPSKNTSTMLAFDLDIYEYEDNTQGRIAKFRIAGYEYDTTNWTRTQVVMDSDGPTDNQYKVIFGVDTNGDKAIWISYYSDGKNGTDQAGSSVWRYPKVSMSNLFCGHLNPPISEWIDGWDIGIVAASDITSTAASHVVSRSLKLYESSYDLASLSINSAFTFPTTDGSADQILKTDGNGNLSWVDSGALGAGAALSIKSTGTQIGDSDIEVLDFSNDFEITETPDKEINISLKNNYINGSFDLTSTTSSFTVTEGYTVGTLNVYHNGIKLYDGEDFTATNGTSFTLTNAAISGDVVEYWGLNIATSATGDTTFGSITASSGQTSFSTTGYTNGGLVVFVNGVKMVNGSDFTATNGSSFTLSSAASSGDIVDYIAYGAVVASTNLQKTGDTMTGNLTVDADLIVTGYKETHIDNGNTGTSQTIAITNSTLQTYTLTDNCAFTMPSNDAGRSFTIFLKTGSGSFTATFTGVKFPQNISPTITTDANRMDIMTFYSDGTNWYGSIQQEYHV